MTALPSYFATTPKAFATAYATASRTLFDSAERLAKLNIGTARGLFDDGSAAARALLQVKRPEDMAALQSASVRPSGEKVLAYYRGCYEIVAQGLEEVAKPLEVQIGEINKLVGATLEKAAKSAPAGSDVALAAVRSAITAANSTYDTMSKATRKALQIAESTLGAGNAVATKAASVPAEVVAPEVVAPAKTA